MRPIEDIERDAMDLAPAPWRTQWDGTLGRCTVFGPERGPERLRIYIERPGYGNVPPEGDFIANARQDIPDLIARVRELEGAIEKYCSLWCPEDRACRNGMWEDCPLYPYRKGA